MVDLGITTFNAGELSPHLHERTDVEKYSAGCRILENMLPLVYGDVVRRPGTQVIAPAKGAVAGCSYTVQATLLWDDAGNANPNVDWDLYSLVDGQYQCATGSSSITLNLPDGSTFGLNQDGHMRATAWSKRPVGSDRSDGTYQYTYNGIDYFSSTIPGGEVMSGQFTDKHTFQFCYDGNIYLAFADGLGLRGTHSFFAPDAAVDDGAATSATSNSVTDLAQTWNVGQYASGYVVTMTSGANSGEICKITANTATALTIDGTWTHTPSGGDTYTINPVGRHFPEHTTFTADVTPKASITSATLTITNTGQTPINVSVGSASSVVLQPGAAYTDTTSIKLWSQDPGDPTLYPYSVTNPIYANGTNLTASMTAAGSPTITVTAGSTSPVDLVPFVYSAGLSYMCEFGNGHIRFYQNGKASSFQDVPSPYAYQDIPDIQYVQQGNTMWLVHGKYPQMKLVLDPVKGFTLTKIPYENGPFLLRNDLDTDNGYNGAVMACSVADKGESGTLSVTGGGYTFQTGHVGALFALTETRANETVHFVLATGAATSDSLLVKGTYGLTTTGTWTGTLSLQRSENGQAWETVKTWTSEANFNVTYADTESGDNVLYNVSAVITSGSVTVDLRVDSTEQTGIVRVDSIVSNNIANVTVLDDLAAGFIAFGNVDSATLTVITDSSQTWGTNALAGKIFTITDGACSGQTAKITANTKTTLTVSPALTNDPTTGNPPDTTSAYAITNTVNAKTTPTTTVTVDVDSGQASSVGSSTLTDSTKAWGTNQYAGYLLTITDGTGAGTTQYTIVSNTATQLTITGTFNPSIDTTSMYVVSKGGVPAGSASPPTEKWAEGCWSDYLGYPAAVTFHEGRIVFAATDHQAQTIWFSGSDSFEDFGEGTNDADAFNIEIATGERIVWMASLAQLAVGTTGDERRVSSSKLEVPLTPTNYNVRVQTTYGSTPIQPARCDQAMLFVDYVSRKVREFTLDKTDANSTYVAPDLTQMAEHVTFGGITAMALQRNPEKILWCVRGDGMLLSLTYERAENVVAWARHPFPAGVTIESVAVLPGVEEDEVWLSALWNGQRYLLRMASRLPSNMFYVDMGMAFMGTAQTAFTGLDYLEGQTVQILGDNAVYPPQNVSNGTVTIPGPGVSTAYVGLPYRYTVQPMRIQVPSRQGTSQGAIVTVRECVFSLLASSGVQYGMDLGNLYDLTKRTREPYGTPPALFTGEIVANMPGGFDTQIPIMVSGNDPLPCDLRAIIVRAERNSR